MNAALSEPLPRVLIADDQPDVLAALRLLLKAAACRSVSAASPAEILAAVRREHFDAALLDLNYTRDTTSGREGLDLLQELHAIDRHLPVIAMTGWGSIDLAVEAMRRGARDFVLKPWDNDALLATVRKSIDEARLQAAVEERQDLKERRLQHDMTIARQVQTNLLPRNPKAVPTLDYAGTCLQAGAVGGDYYDFLDLGRGVFGAVLADVSGKGISAALLMSNLQATLRSQCSVGHCGLSTLLKTVNRLFLESTEPQHYATLFAAAYDPATRKLRYLNCGHNPALLLRAEGNAEWLESTATVLGLLPQWPCEESEIALRPGDTLVMYSDGVTEAGRDRGDEFGNARLCAAVARRKGMGAAELAEDLAREVREWAGAVQEDDLTVVALRGV